jgi:hypothetical protein
MTASIKSARLYIAGEFMGEVTDVHFTTGEGRFEAPVVDDWQLRESLTRSVVRAVLIRRLGLMLAQHYRDLARRSAWPGDAS